MSQKKFKYKKKDFKKNSVLHAKASVKIKAFLTDTFMLILPMLYVVIYLIMGGREDFSQNKVLGWFYIFFPLVIVQTIFMIKTSQTPGYRAYDLYIVDDISKEKPSSFIIFFRNLCAILSFFSFIGWTMMFFRKDSKTLHDLLSRTSIIQKKPS